MSTAPSRDVLLVGATSGIGRETALAFARQGARLALAARSNEVLHEVADACRDAGAADVLVRSTDIGERAEVEALVEAAVARHGHLDVIVHCAAVTAFARFEELPPDVFDGVVRTNVIGTANVARAVLPHLRRRRLGTLVLVGSALGHATFPYQAPYVMSKFAISALVRLLRQENHDVPGVRIHGVYPGPVDTPLYATAGNFTGRQAQVPPPADHPATVAEAIVRVANERRHRDRGVGWANGATVLAYRLLPGLYDAIVEPFVRITTFARETLQHTPGNVFAPAAPVSSSRPDASSTRDAAVDGASHPRSSRPPRGSER